MKKAKYLLAVLAGVIVYVLLCSTCGRNGIWAANQLLEQKRSISANTQAIENINEELKEKDQLQWVGLMNNLKNTAEEIVLREYIN